MEQQLKFKVNMNTYRRLDIEHKVNEKLLKQNYLLNLKFYKYREEIFNRKIDRRRKSLEYYSSQTSKLSKQIFNSNKEKSYQLFLNQQISNEHKNNEQKAILLKQFDELKHTINDPHSTLSTLAALSRSLRYLDSRIK